MEDQPLTDVTEINGYRGKDFLCTGLCIKKSPAIT